MSKFLALASSAAFLVSCSDSGKASPDGATTSDSGADDSGSRDSSVPNPNRCDSASYSLYLNFDETSYTQANTANPANNESVFSTGTLAASTLSTSERVDVVTCVDKLVARYNLKVVTQEPAGSAYDEIHIGGAGTSVGLPSNIESIGASSCNDRQQQVNFVFEIADACAQIGFVTGVSGNVGSSILPNHCSPMNSKANRESCTEIAFREAELGCTDLAGEASACPCEAGATQIEHNVMLASYGACPL